MNPGKLNRRLTIQSRTVTKDSAGGKVETWADVFDCWAELVQSKGSEGNAADSDRPSNEKQFRLRWKSGIEADTHRILYKLVFYDISEVIEEGVKTSLLIRATAIKNLVH